MLVRKWVLVAAFVAALGVLSACAGQSTDVRPPEIVYGQDMCDECGMLISEPQFAAALVLENGDPVKFDDLGELFHYPERHPDSAVKAWFVHDFNTEAWVNAEAATYVVVPGFATPMGFGVAAFEQRADAEAFAAEQGEAAAVLTFEQIMDDPPGGMGMGMSGKMHE